MCVKVGFELTNLLLDVQFTIKTIRFIVSKQSRQIGANLLDVWFTKKHLANKAVINCHWWFQVWRSLNFVTYLLVMFLFDVGFIQGDLLTGVRRYKHLKRRFQTSPLNLSIDRIDNNTCTSCLTLSQSIFTNVLHQDTLYWYFFYKS